MHNGDDIAVISSFEVALEAAKGSRTLSELAQEYQLPISLELWVIPNSEPSHVICFIKKAPLDILPVSASISPGRITQVP